MYILRPLALNPPTILLKPPTILLNPPTILLNPTTLLLKPPTIRHYIAKTAHNRAKTTFSANSAGLSIETTHHRSLQPIRGESRGAAANQKRGQTSHDCYSLYLSRRERFVMNYLVCSLGSFIRL